MIESAPPVVPGRGGGRMTEFQARAGTAVVAGGTGGIGRAICRRLAEEGSSVLFTYRTNQQAAQRLTEELRRQGVEAQGLPADLGDRDQAAAVTASALEEFGAIHTLVYAAGPHVPMVHLSKVNSQEFGNQVNADVLGFFNFLRPAMTALRESKGSLVAVTTTATRRYPARDVLSAAPKGAIEQLVKAVAGEEGRFGVRANCVGPGLLRDGMARRLIESGDLDQRALDVVMTNIPLRQFGKATDIADAVVFLASDRAGYISGQMLDVDGGYGL